MTACSVDGCAREDRIIRGLCHKHYEYMRKHGTPVFIENREHGTLAGYWQHWRRKEEQCTRCRQAFRAYSNELRARPENLEKSREQARHYSRLRYRRDPERFRRQMQDLAEAQNSVDAHRKGMPWTEEELLIVATNNHLSLYELASLLGRTCASVKAKRGQRIFDGTEKHYQGTDPDSVKRHRESLVNRIQQSTLTTAERSGQPWTGPELEVIATRDDLSSSQLAKQLGRTYHATRLMRLKLRQEEREGQTKLIKLAGHSRPGEQPGTGDQVHQREKVINT